MKKILLINLFVLLVINFAKAENMLNSLKLYISHKYILKQSKTKPVYSCLASPNMTRKQYETKKQTENQIYRAKMSRMLKSGKENIAIAYVTKKMKLLRNTFKRSTEKSNSDKIEVTESTQLSKTLGKRLHIRNNNLYIASDYICDFLDGKLDKLNVVKLLFYSDVIQNDGWIYSKLPETK